MSTHPPPDLASLEQLLMELTERIDRRDRMLAEAVHGAVREGTAEGMRAALKDEEFIDHFWQVGYDKMSKRLHEDVSRSVGKRVLAWAGGVLFALAIYVSVKAGVIK